MNPLVERAAKSFDEEQTAKERSIELSSEQSIETVHIEIIVLEAVNKVWPLMDDDSEPPLSEAGRDEDEESLDWMQDALQDP